MEKKNDSHVVYSGSPSSLLKVGLLLHAVTIHYVTYSCSPRSLSRGVYGPSLISTHNSDSIYRQTFKS